MEIAAPGYATKGYRAFTSAWFGDSHFFRTIQCFHSSDFSLGNVRSVKGVGTYHASPLGAAVPLRTTMLFGLGRPNNLVLLVDQSVLLGRFSFSYVCHANESGAFWEGYFLPKTPKAKTAAVEQRRIPAILNIVALAADQDHNQLFNLRSFARGKQNIDERVSELLSGGEAHDAEQRIAASPQYH